MAADMVASVTLRLRDQMSVGIDEIKRQFGSVQATLDRLTGVMGDLQRTLDALWMPAGVNQALGRTVADARAAAGAVTSIGAAADANVGRFRKMNAALSAWGAMGGPIDGVNASAIGGAPSDKTSTRAPGDREGGAPHEGKGLIHSGGDWLTDGIIGAIAVGSGYDAVKKYGEYDKTLRQTAIAEKLSGPQVKDEEARLASLFDHLALKDRQPSAALADAYYRMITTHIPPAIVTAVMPAIGMMATAHDVSPYDLADAAFAINDSFKIGTKGVLPALEMLATAAKQAHFSLANFGFDLKTIGGVAELSGMTGRHSLDMVAASLETVIKNSTQPNQAAADYRDFLFYLNSTGIQMAGERLMFKRRLAASEPLFEKYHIKPVSIWNIEAKAKSKGLNPQEAVIDYLHQITKPMTAGDRAKYLGTIFGNQQSATFVESELLHWKSYNALVKKLDAVTSATGASDFAAAMGGANTQVTKLDEALTQLERGLGRRLLPVIHAVNWALEKLPTDGPKPSSTLSQVDVWRRANRNYATTLYADDTGGDSPPPIAVPGYPATNSRSNSGLSDPVSTPPTPANSDHAAAIKSHAAALREHVDALRNAAIMHPTAPPGPFLSRP